MLWYRALNKTSCKCTLEYGVASGNSRWEVQILQTSIFFKALTYHLTKVLTNHQQICSSFPELNPPCRNTFRFQYTRLTTLASTATIFINPVRISLCRKEEKEEKDLFQRNNRDFYCLSDCSLKTIVQKHKVTALIASYSSINIL